MRRVIVLIPDHCLSIYQGLNPKRAGVVGWCDGAG